MNLRSVLPTFGSFVNYFSAGESVTLPFSKNPTLPLSAGGKRSEYRTLKRALSSLGQSKKSAILPGEIVRELMESAVGGLYGRQKALCRSGVFHPATREELSVRLFVWVMVPLDNGPRNRGGGLSTGPGPLGYKVVPNSVSKETRHGKTIGPVLVLFEGAYPDRRGNRAENPNAA
jgi:hypothetical protein